MSVYVTSWVWDNATTIGGNDLLVLLAIADHADETGANAWPSVATLARKTRLNGRTVQRITRRLTDAGHLLVEATTGGRRSNRYTVLMTTPPAPTALPDPPVDEPPATRTGPPTVESVAGHPGYPQTSGCCPQPPAPRRPSGPPPRHDTTAPPATVPPQHRRNRATRTPLTHPRNTPGAARRPGGPPTTPPGRCPYHLGQSAHHCGPCRSERLGAE